VDRCALFVDASYALSDGAMAVHGTRHRDSVSWDYAGVLKLLAGLARDRTGLPVLRCYWYEATVDSRRTSEHETLAELPGLKLRLGKMRPGRREGVETEIHRDLMTLARNGAVSDAVIVSAEEDLAQVVAEAQDLGIRIVIVHITVDGNWTISRLLRQESDDIIEISGAHLRPFVDLIPGAEPARADEQYAGSHYQGRNPSNGRSQTGAAVTRQGLPAAALPAPAIYPAPVEAGYQRSSQSLAAAAAGSPSGQRTAQASAVEVPSGSMPGPDAAGTAQVPPGLVGSRGDSRGEPSGGDQPRHEDAPPLPGQQAYPQPEQLRGPVQASAQNGMPQSAVSQAGTTQAGMSQSGMSQSGMSQSGSPQSRPPQSPLPSGSLQQNPLPQGVPPQSSLPQRNGPTQNGMPQSGLPQSGLPQSGGSQAGGSQSGLPQSGGTQNGLPQNGLPQNGLPPGGRTQSGASQNGLSQNGLCQNGLPQNGLPQNGQPNGLPPNGLPGTASPRSAGPQRQLGSGTGPPYPRGPTAPYGADQPPHGHFGSTPPGQHSAVGHSSGFHPASPGPYSGPQPAASHAPALPPVNVSLADAVQAAHVEGFGFGEAVARDAPALWLEAVLARKPRMPSDLEARLLQGSALPIDSLLHDEVRHALRRGFWDALERSRR
jgi:hypothetical protein